MLQHQEQGRNHLPESGQDIFPKRGGMSSFQGVEQCLLSGGGTTSSVRRRHNALFPRVARPFLCRSGISALGAESPLHLSPFLCINDLSSAEAASPPRGGTAGGISGQEFPNS